MSLHLSKCHIVGNHMSWLITVKEDGKADVLVGIDNMTDILVVVMQSPCTRKKSYSRKLQIRSIMFLLSPLSLETLPCTDSHS